MCWVLSVCGEGKGEGMVRDVTGPTGVQRSALVWRRERAPRPPPPPPLPADESRRARTYTHTYIHTRPTTADRALAATRAGGACF